MKCWPMCASKNVTRFPYEVSRLTQDLAGGIMVTMPSEADFEHEVAGPILKKYMKGYARHLAGIIVTDAD